jgi:hypothetical protein
MGDVARYTTCKTALILGIELNHFEWPDVIGIIVKE